MKGRGYEFAALGRAARASACGPIDPRRREKVPRKAGCCGDRARTSPTIECLFGLCRFTSMRTPIHLLVFAAIGLAATAAPARLCALAC